MQDLQQWFKEKSWSSIQSITTNHLDCLLYWKQIRKRLRLWSMVPLRRKVLHWLLLVAEIPYLTQVP
uniref:Uncharacterized protein n=1 Tax=Arundo donax TaxID=35708 RepID=A0A0A9FD29_ARUDO